MCKISCLSMVRCMRFLWYNLSCKNNILCDSITIKCFDAGGMKMYQSFIYLEVRVLLSNKCGVFVQNKDGYTVDSDVLKKICTLTQALSSSPIESSPLEKLTGSLPNLPEDKKITGCSLLVSKGGFLDIMFHQKAKAVRVENIRIEEDCGRLTHKDGKTQMDFTYAGCPSLRLRTESCFELGEEAELFLEELKNLLQYLHIAVNEVGDNCIRCNAFVSIAESEKSAHYVKLRNLNSFNFVRKAINAECSRQEGLLFAGENVAEESRIWIEEQNVTDSYQARSKEVVHFKKCEQPCSVPVASLFKAMQIPVIESQRERRARFREEYGVSRLRAEFLCSDKDRADFFEEAVKCGAEPLTAAHWIASEVMRVLNYSKTTIDKTHITSQKFAQIISLLTQQKIHSGIAKELIQEAAKCDDDIETLMAKSGKNQIANESDILPYVRSVLKANESSSARLKAGDMVVLEYLTGLVMKETQGRAVPLIVKELIKKELNISLIYVLGMGGSITAVRRKDGSVESGGAQSLRDLCKKVESDIPLQSVMVKSLLSEEIEPGDFAYLIAEISAKITAGNANGIVVAHGTDTLPYTAALLFWLFGSSKTPIVLTASSSIAEDSDESLENLSLAVKTAGEKKCGVYVAYNKKILSPLNLKFEKFGKDGFCNWNLDEDVFTESGIIASQFSSVQEPDAQVMKRILEESAGKMCFFRTYPGFRADLYEKMIDEDLDTLFIELYAAGTGNMRNSDFSLKPLLQKCRRKNCRVYCTSQQENSVNFSQFVTSANVWRGGAVPMGKLTTESAIALYYASSLLSDSPSETAQIIESYAEAYS